MGKIKVYNSSSKWLIHLEIILTMIVVGMIIRVSTEIHPAINIVIALISGIILRILFIKKYGFIIISFLFSILWAYSIGYWTYTKTNDWIWGAVVALIVFLISLGSHYSAKDYYDNIED